MKLAYDRERARKLIPLLGSITREISERSHEARILQGRLTKLEDLPLCDEFMNLKAQLAVHKLELRHALQELDRLGCVLDQSAPGQICIPGQDGDLGHGFRFDPSSCSLRRTATGISVP